jgi:hypothetical protein
MEWSGRWADTFRTTGDAGGSRASDSRTTFERDQEAMIKTALLLKFGFMGTAAAAFILLSESMGIESLGFPHTWQLIFNGFVAGWALKGFLGSYVGGMVPPDEESTRAYKHYYQTMHLMFNRSTAALVKASALEALLPTGEK